MKDYNWHGVFKGLVPIQPKPGGGVEAAMKDCDACGKEYYVHARHDLVCLGEKK